MAKKQDSKSTNGKRAQPNGKKSGKELSIKFIFPEGQRAFSCNFATVQREGQQFHLSFFEIRPPILIGTEEQVKEQLDEIESVQAHCLARIVMSSDRAEGLIAALSTQLAKSKKEAPGLSKTDKKIVALKKTTSDSQRDSSKKK